MRKHIRFMGLTYTALYFAFLLLRLSGVDAFDNDFCDEIADTFWGAGMAMLAALWFGPKDGDQK